MLNGLFVLLGALVGGTASVVASWLASKSELQKLKLANDDAAKRREEQTREAWRERKLERFATFLGAYYVEEARIVETIANFKNQRSGWQKRVVAIVDDAKRDEDLDVLNRSLGWISLLSSRSGIQHYARECSEVFDRLQDQLVEAGEAARANGHVATAPLEATLKDLQRTVGGLTDIFRHDVDPQR